MPELRARPPAEDADGFWCGHIHGNPKGDGGLKGPDALFRGLLESGEVSLDDVSKYEALFGYFPYAAWVARVTHIFFLGETPKVVTELMACLRGLQFVSPAGDLNMHAPYLELSTLLNKCAVQHASYNIRDVVLILCEQLEKVPEGKWPAFDVLMDRVLRRV